MTFQRKITKNLKFAKQQCWNSSSWNVKELCTNTVFFLDSTFKLIFNENFSTWDKMLHLMLLLGINRVRKSCWRAWPINNHEGSQLFSIFFYENMRCVPKIFNDIQAKKLSDTVSTRIYIYFQYDTGPNMVGIRNIILETFHMFE